MIVQQLAVVLAKQVFFHFSPLKNQFFISNFEKPQLVVYVQARSVICRLRGNVEAESWEVSRSLLSFFLLFFTLKLRQLKSLYI